MSSQAYIADNDGNNKVYFEVEPSPKPLPVYTPVHSKKRTMNKYSEGEIIPGEYHHYIGGARESGAVISCNIKKLSKSGYDSIVSKMKKAESVIFSPDGSTQYECCFSENSGQAGYIDGTNYIQWNLVFESCEEG